MKGVLIIVMFSLMAVSSCGSGEEPTKTTVFRIIKNESSYVVDLEIYDKPQKDFRLEKGDSIVMEGYCLSGVGTGYCIVGWDNIDIISGKIIFDSEREIYYPSGSCDTLKIRLVKLGNSIFVGIQSVIMAHSKSSSILLMIRIMSWQFRLVIDQAN